MLVTDPDALNGGVIAAIVIFYAVIIIVSIVAWVKILNKAGYSGWWVLIALVPLANIVMFLVFAFSEWPTLRELKVLRSTAGAAPPPPGGAPLPPPP